MDEVVVCVWEVVQVLFFVWFVVLVVGLLFQVFYVVGIVVYVDFVVVLESGVYCVDLVFNWWVLFGCVDCEFGFLQDGQVGFVGVYVMLVIVGGIWVYMDGMIWVMVFDQLDYVWCVIVVGDFVDCYWVVVVFYMDYC